MKQYKLEFGEEEKEFNNSEFLPEPQVEINPGHYLELMDRLAVQADVIHNYIYGHPLTERLPEVNAKVEAALTTLYEAYQLVGNEDYNQNKS